MILYFSGTGNSRYVAKKLAKDGEKVVDAFKFSDTEITGNRFGIVFPVYCGGLPPYFINIIKKLSIKTEYIFAVATCGGNAGRSFHNLQYLLNEKGNKLSYGAEIVMPDSCVMLYNPKTTKTLIAFEDTKINKIKDEINESKTIDFASAMPYNLAQKVSWYVFKKIIGVDRKKASKKCILCNECIENCPTNNIFMENGKVKFDHKCADCFRCINLCPVQAIRFGGIKPTKEKQYMHK